MSAFNWFSTRKKAFDTREKDVNAAYTVRVGGTSDNFIIDRVVTVTDPSDNFTITVPDGKYRGQRLLVSLASNASNKRATVSTTGGNYKLQYNGMYVSLEWVEAGTGGWVSLANYST